MLQVLFKTPEPAPVRQIEPYHGLVVRRDNQIGMVFNRLPNAGERPEYRWVFVSNVASDKGTGLRYDTESLIRCLNQSGWREVSADLVIGDYVS